LKRATQIAPASPTAWFQYGAVDYALGQVDEAIAKMEKAIALDPELPGAHTGLAELLAGTGKLDRAATALKSSPRLCTASVRLCARAPERGAI
jgi:tetratricopeptide (TPR) repeat protein